MRTATQPASCQTLPAVRLRRQGVSEMLKADLPSGTHIEIAYHHGGKYVFCNTYRYSKNPRGEGWADICHSEHIKLRAPTVEEALDEVAFRFQVAFLPEIEAYCYASAKGFELWPHIAQDVYITCARYEPETDTIRHEPSNRCLIVFDDNDPVPGTNGPHWDKVSWPRAHRYESSGNMKWAEQIDKALESYNSNVGAHGLGQERKEWLAWLVGEYIKDDCADETPVLRRTMTGK